LTGASPSIECRSAGDRARLRAASPDEEEPDDDAGYHSRRRHARAFGDFGKSLKDIPLARLGMLIERVMH